MSDLSDAITRYYNIRMLRWPADAYQGLAWMHSEIGEVYEQLLARTPGWVRNNPDDHGEYSEERFEEELGDVLMMVQVAGMVAGVDPAAGLARKMGRKLAEVVE